VIVLQILSPFYINSYVSAPPVSHQACAYVWPPNLLFNRNLNCIKPAPTLPTIFSIFIFNCYILDCFLTKRQVKGLRRRFRYHSTGWTVRDANTGKGNRIFSSTKRPGLRGPSSLVLNECQGSFLEKSGWRMTLNTHLHPTPRMRISGAIPLLPLYDFIDRTRTNLPFTFYHKEARRSPDMGHNCIIIRRLVD